MPAIDRDQLLGDVKEELSQANILSEARILAIAESVILKVGDDDQYYPEVFCKTLKGAAELNKARAVIHSKRSFKREETYERVLERFPNFDPVKYWDEYLKSVGDVCIAYGYNGMRSGVSYGFYANVPTKIVAPRCNNPYGSEADREGCKDCRNFRCNCED